MLITAVFADASLHQCHSLCLTLLLFFTQTRKHVTRTAILRALQQAERSVQLAIWRVGRHLLPVVRARALSS
jgi:hypothetical protein